MNLAERQEWLQTQTLSVEPVSLMHFWNFFWPGLAVCGLLAIAMLLFAWYERIGRHARPSRKYDRR